MNQRRDEVVLLYPGRYLPSVKPAIPLSLLSLAGPLKKAGFNPIIIDGRIEKAIAALESKICDRTLLVGISAMTGHMITFGLEYASLIRGKLPGLPIVWGGVHPTIDTERTLATSDFVDIVGRGEGEETIVELARTLAAGGDLSRVLGISYKLGSRVVHNVDRDLLNLDSLPMVSYGDFVDLSRYYIDGLLYQSARGCPHRCRFCDVLVFNRNKIRSKSVSRVLDDLENLIGACGARGIEFVDDNFFSNKQRAISICHGIIERRLKFSWIASCRASYFRKTDVEFWNIVKSAGCNTIYVGAESGSQRILDYIQKDCLAEDIYGSADILSKACIKMACNFMIGFPEETPEDVRATLKVARDLAETYESVHVGGILLYAPYPGTSLYEEALRHGYRPPRTLEEWGRFILNDPRNSPWVRDLEHLYRIAIVSRWKRNHSGRDLIEFLRMGRPRFIVKALLEKVAFLRYKWGYYAFPIDIKFCQMVNKYYMKVG